MQLARTKQTQLHRSYFTIHFSAPVAPENEEELVMMNQWLKYNKEPEDQVTVFMGKTAFYRQKRIKESLGSVNTTIAEFPRLLDPGMVKFY